MINFFKILSFLIDIFKEWKKEKERKKENEKIKKALHEKNSDDLNNSIL